MPVLRLCAFLISITVAVPCAAQERDASALLSHARRLLGAGERNANGFRAIRYTLRANEPVSAVRVEAVETELQRAARAIKPLGDFATTGFGTSDLLLAQSVAEPTNRAAKRWTDFSTTPLAGNIATATSSVALVWETYFPTDTSRTARLHVTIGVARDGNDGLVRHAVRLLSGMRNALYGNQRSDGQTISYTREFPVTSIAVEHVQLDIGSREPGRYLVSITVTNLNSGESVSTSQLLEIAK